MTTDTLACGHPAACLSDGACGWCVAVDDARLHMEESDGLAVRVDELEAALVDAIHAREQAESAISAGVAVLDREALVAETRALLAAATPIDEWRASWDAMPRECDGHPWSLFAVGPEHGSPADPATPEYQRASSLLLADARLIAAAPRLLAAFAAPLASTPAVSLEDKT